METSEPAPTRADIVAAFRRLAEMVDEQEWLTEELEPVTEREAARILERYVGGRQP